MNYQRIHASGKTMSEFSKKLAAMAADIHANAFEKGFWECATCKGGGKIRPLAEGASRLLCPVCGGTGEHVEVGTLIALVHSELSEALEAKRNPEDDAKCDKCSGFAVISRVECPKCKGTGDALGGSRYAEELADAVIRILDMAAADGIDLGSVIEAKHEYNKTRPHRHEKAF
jgi:RecJ-like exonuclease